MTEFFDIIKETAAYKRFINDLEGESVAHTYLIECSDKVLVGSFVKICAAFLICKSGGCFSCSSCKKVLSGCHPDVVTLPKKDKNMTVSDVKTIIDECSMMPVEGGVRVVAIDCWGIINDDWQNKLLKILEEPSSDTYFFLTTPCRDRLLPTVLSRSRQIVLVPDGSAVAAELIKRGIEKKTAESISRLSRGSVMHAVALSSPEGLELVNLVEEFFSSAKNSRDALPYVVKFEKYRDRAGELLDVMSSVLFSAMKGESNSARDYGPEACAEAMVRINDAKEKLNRYCVFNIILDNLIMQILEVKYRCRK